MKILSNPEWSVVRIRTADLVAIRKMSATTGTSVAKHLTEAVSLWLKGAAKQRLALEKKINS